MQFGLKYFTHTKKTDALIRQINPDKMKIGYIILVASKLSLIVKFQKKVGYGGKARWTHVAGSIGGYNIIEATYPQSRVCNMQKQYIDKGYEIKVLKRKEQTMNKRIKTALWWATMNNLPYDILQIIWFPLASLFGGLSISIYNLFARNKRFVCSELITSGYYKENDYLFNKPQSKIFPADFDNSDLFDEVTDVWIK